MWSKGDSLNFQNLNQKTISLAGKGRSGGIGQSAASSSPDLVFRQESSPMPSDGEEFPVFYARRAVKILGIICFSTSGTYDVTLNSDTSHTPDADLISFVNTDEPAKKFLAPNINGFVGEGEEIRLKVTSSDGVEGFQCNVILRLLG